MSIALESRVAELEQTVAEMTRRQRLHALELRKWMKEIRAVVALYEDRPNLRRPMTVPPFPRSLLDIGLEAPDGGTQ